jgi:hypothetical protein
VENALSPEGAFSLPSGRKPVQSLVPLKNLKNGFS